MKRYEVTRELFNACSGKYEIDLRFPDETKANDTLTAMQGFYNGNLPEYEVKTAPNGSVVYTIKGAVSERYTFSEF